MRACFKKLYMYNSLKSTHLIKQLQTTCESVGEVVPRPYFERDGDRERESTLCNYSVPN